MEAFSGNFTFKNKENTQHFQKAPPKTPLNTKSIIFQSNNNNNNNNTNNIKKIDVLQDGFKTPSNPKTIKRVPLGGKDHNVANNHSKPLKSGAGTLLTSSVTKRRAQRLKTPLTNKQSSDLGKKKLNVLRDDNENEQVPVVMINDDLDNDNNDYELEYAPEKDPELPFVPLNYKPFTEKELEFFRNAKPNPRLEDLRNEPDNVDPYEEFSISFSDVEPDEDVEDTEDQLPHFMEPTFVSRAKKVNTKPMEDFDGLSTSDFNRLIEE